MICNIVYISNGSYCVRSVCNNGSISAGPSAAARQEESEEKQQGDRARAWRVTTEERERKRSNIGVAGEARPAAHIRRDTFPFAEIGSAKKSSHFRDAQCCWELRNWFRAARWWHEKQLGLARRGRRGREAKGMRRTNTDALTTTKEKKTRIK